MNTKTDELTGATPDVATETGTVADYDRWLKAQLEQAVGDINDPKRIEIEHDEVFEKLDAIIVKHETS